MPLRALALAAVAAGLMPAAAGAFESPWSMPGQMAVSPDGRHLYASGSRTLSFARDTGAGTLTEVSDIEPGGEAIAISPDGRSVYVGTRGWIHALVRDAESGLLTHVRTLPAGPADVTGLAVSPDGTTVHAVADRLLTFARDAATSDLSSRGEQAGPGGNALRALVLSADGTSLYAGSGTGVAVFRIAGGEAPRLEQVAPTSGSAVMALALVSGERRLVTGGVEVEVFDREPAGGRLGEPRRFVEFGSDMAKMPGCCGQWIAGGPGDDLYGIDRGHEVLVHATAPAEGPRRVGTYGRRGVPGLEAMAEPETLVLSPDAGFLHVAARSAPTAGPVGRGGAILTLRRDAAGGGLTPVATTLPLIGAPGPRRELIRHGSLRTRFAIEEGRRFTNDRELDLEVLAPDGVASLRVDDGAGRSSGLLRVRPDGRYRFTTSGESGPRRVTVTFTFAGSQLSTPTVTDEIVVDRRDPEVVEARRSGARLLLRARDDRAGVAAVQVGRARSRFRRFRRRMTVSATATQVRVRDRAGNVSRWRAIR
jgi:hypothetical protein